jgi:hypothetical protein
LPLGGPRRFAWAGVRHRQPARLRAHRHSRRRRYLGRKLFDASLDNYARQRRENLAAAAGPPSTAAEVIGINAAISSRAEHRLLVPINGARAILPQLGREDGSAAGIGGPGMIRIFNDRSS